MGANKYLFITIRFFSTPKKYINLFDHSSWHLLHCIIFFFCAIFIFAVFLSCFCENGHWLFQQKKKKTGCKYLFKSCLRKIKSAFITEWDLYLPCEGKHGHPLHLMPKYKVELPSASLAKSLPYIKVALTITTIVLKVGMGFPGDLAGAIPGINK